RLEVGERLRDAVQLDVRVRLLELLVQLGDRSALAAADLLVPDEERDGLLLRRVCAAGRGGGAREREQRRERRERDEAPRDSSVHEPSFADADWTVAGSSSARARSSSWSVAALPAPVAVRTERAAYTAARRSRSASGSRV